MEPTNFEENSLAQTRKRHLPTTAHTAHTAHTGFTDPEGKVSLLIHDKRVPATFYILFRSQVLFL